LLAALGGLCATVACAPGATDGTYFGQVDPPQGQTLRYVTGGEPESLDPQVGTGQPEARIYVALFEGLTDYDPVTAEPVPGLAERWDVLDGNTLFVFHLRRDARFSDGTPVTARDVVYTFRRGLAPAFASRNAYMAYDILNAQAYNEGALFARDPRTGQFAMASDGVQRLVLPSDPDARDDVLTPEARAAIEGHDLVPVRAEDVGVEAPDDHTVRIRTVRPVPFLPGLVAHQFFRVVPQQAIDEYGDSWTRPGRLISSGPYVLETWRPYDRISVVRNAAYWDNETVRLDRITFFALEEATTMMNLYKAGELDAVYNHVVPVAWLDSIAPLQDYMNAPEAANEYYMFNVTRPPLDDLRVRKAFNMAVDKVALAEFRRVAKPLRGFVPEGIYPGYPHPGGDPFDVPRARALLADAGYRDASGEYDPSTFPAGEMDITYNTSESNRQVAEFVQAQWRQNLGVTIPLRNMEFRTLLALRAEGDYRGALRAGWVGDYMDPFTFLDIFSTPGGNNGSGWFDPAYVQMLRDANEEADPERRFQMLARAEAYLLEAQPIMPLLTAATNWMKKPYVRGMYANPVTIHSWKHVYIEHDPAAWE
jgi:oligopeptide transport system substrate-binding protein